MSDKAYERSTTKDVIYIVLLFMAGLLSNWVWSCSVHAQTFNNPLGASAVSDYIARVCCKDQKPDVCWNPEYRFLEDTRLGFCVEIHEDDHLLWLSEKHPDICKERENGFYAFWLTLAEMYETECRAYSIQLPCLLEQDLFPMYRDIRSMAETQYGCDFKQKRGANQCVIKLLSRQETECCGTDDNKKK